jgi:hypothetical protein
MGQVFTADRFRFEPYNLWFQQHREYRNAFIFNSGDDERQESFKQGWFSIIPFLSCGVDYFEIFRYPSIDSIPVDTDSASVDVCLRDPKFYSDEGRRRAVMVQTDLIPALKALPDIMVAGLTEPSQLVPWPDHEARPLFDAITSHPVDIVCHGISGCVTEYAKDWDAVARLREKHGIISKNPLDTFSE